MRPGRALARLMLLALAVTLGFAAAPPEPPQLPFLRIEAGGHTGSVPRLAIDSSGRIMASAGYDKTVRLWTVEDGKELAVLRPPIGTRQEGEIYAVAMTPDARRVFAAGATGHAWDGTFSIYLFDTVHARLAGLLPGLPAPVFDLAVSPDGTRLAAGLAQEGVRVWDAGTGKPVFADRAYGGPVRAVAFDRQNRLFATAADGRVRAYDPGGRRIAEAQPEPGLRPWGLAVSPDGDLVAVTFENADRQGKLHVDVLSATTLARVFSPDTSGLKGEGLLAVAWAPGATGGAELLAGGYARAEGHNVIRRWGDYGLGAPRDLPAARDTILDIVPDPEGGAVFSAEDPGWGRIGPDGAILLRPAPPAADLRPAREQRLALSHDGTVVEFATGNGLIRFDATNRGYGSVTAPDPALAAARTAAPGVSVTGWRDTSAPRLNNRPLALDNEEISRSLALLPDGRVLLGTDTHLRLYGRDGRQVAMVDTPAAAWAVDVNDAGTVAVAALLDGTLRWYGLDAAAPLAERAALFADADGARWVLFTPEGFFDHADRGGADLVGVHLNGGRNQQPEWISFGQAYRALYAPAVVRARLTGDPGPARARLAELGDLRARLARQPEVAISAACIPRPAADCQKVALGPHGVADLPAEARTLQLHLRVTERGLGLGALDLFVNDRNAGRFRAPEVTGGSAETDVAIALDPGANTVQARLYDGSNAIFSESTPLRLRRPQAPGARQAGRLFVLAIGIDHFTRPELTLHDAVADATAFADTVRQTAAPLYPEIDVTLLADAKATRAGILDALDRLGREVKSGDTFLFYVASHGVRSEADGRFLLIPQDVGDVSSWQAIARSAIDESTLIAALARIQARDALLFLDTCYSGQVTADSLANVGHETGRYLLAASSSVQEALDSYDNRNGVFVYAVREGLEGRAPHGADGIISALSLGEYVSRRVSELARRKGHAQDAEFKAAQAELRSFPLAKVSQPP